MTAVIGTLDTIVRVDRKAPLTKVYPTCVDKVLHPELEALGPDRYDLLAQTELYVPVEIQSAKDLYEKILGEGALGRYLSLHDAIGIKRRGVNVFRRIFQGSSVCFLRTVIRYPDGRLYTPSLYDTGVKVGMSWTCLNQQWRSGQYYARFVTV